MDLASLFGPSPIFLTREQVLALQQYATEHDDAVGVMILNEGGLTVTARRLVGTRPIPSESEVDPQSETVIGAKGGFYPVGLESNDDTETQTKVEAALELASEEGAELTAAYKLTLDAEEAVVQQ